MMRTVLCGVGAFLPQKVVTNDDLSLIVDTTDEWIFRRTGIRRRHIVAEDETTVYMAVKAAVDALDASGVTADTVDLIIVATSTPDKTLPSCAAAVQGRLGCRRAMVFDLNAACSGFVYSLAVVDGLIRTGHAKVALLIGAEAMSKIVDWHDRSTCVLFGDGAGACVLRGEETDNNAGIISTLLGADGALSEVLSTDGGVASTGTAGKIRMSGTVLFEHAILRQAASITELLNMNSVSIDDIDWFIPHQANIRIVESVAKRLGFPMEKIVLGIEDHANTSAASIPLAMKSGLDRGDIRKGQLVLLTSFGAGITWGSSLIRL
ncbi:3-oxoacyl-[acyl-carrier-protein] synthase 3 [Anaplasma platys]|uniref:Beta-ketoacyl-[acyl-carrier-protein] synthase III n=1 Tax=Anaplasma platys TaxID=949 RepID=A0A858PXQ3_9RICK|nr:beta-ketoacyl-ACP synthase III [Anaplasma platys]QJC27383.1 3-oxoacyl-[acyl-carrier-protein] synthase 3 [Anaplasma platys]